VFPNNDRSGELDPKIIRTRLEAVVNALYGMGPSDADSVDWILSGRGEELDSVLVLRLVLAIEQEFAIVFQDEEIRPEIFADLEALAAFIQRKMTGASNGAS
jgi:acyl carrier protein